MAGELVGKIPPELKAYQDLEKLFLSSFEGDYSLSMKHMRLDSGIIFIERDEEKKIFIVNLDYYGGKISSGEEFSSVHFVIAESGLQSLDVKLTCPPGSFVKISKHFVDNYIRPDIHSTAYESPQLLKGSKPIVKWITKVVKEIKYSDPPIYIQTSKPKKAKQQSSRSHGHGTSQPFHTYRDSSKV